MLWMKDKPTKPILIAILSLVFLSGGALAGSLTPAGSVASTMHSLTELYDSIAGTFDATSIVANQNGSLMQQLKYIENSTVWASGSNNIWNLNSGNVGIASSSPGAQLAVEGGVRVDGGMALGNRASINRDDYYAGLGLGTQVGFNLSNDYSTLPFLTESMLNEV